VAYEGDFRPGNVILNMLMIRTDINAVMWSMKVECVATPVILFGVWLVQRNGASWLWAIIAALFALSFWGPYVHALGDSSNLASFYAFLVGVLAQHYGRRIAGIRPSVATIAALLSVLVFCYLGTRKQTAPVLMLECVCAACLVALIAWRPVALFAPSISELSGSTGRSLTASTCCTFSASCLRTRLWPPRTFRSLPCRPLSP